MTACLRQVARRTTLLGVCLFLIPFSVACLNARAEAPDHALDATTGLIMDDGWEQVRANCSSCHSLALVTQNRGDAAHWRHLIHWMQAEHKLWDLGANEAVIVDYLAQNYAATTYQPRRLPLVTDWQPATTGE